MLTGEVEHQLDERGRVVVPRSWRQAFEHGGFVTRGWYGCLFLFTWDAWREIAEKLATVRITDAPGDRLKQFLGAGENVTLDAQGRLLISPSLREFAGMDGDVVLSGAVDRIEVWAKDRVKQYRREQFSTEQIMEMLEKAKELGI
jgi:MraZ protein